MLLKHILSVLFLTNKNDQRIWRDLLLEDQWIWGIVLT